MGAHVLVVRFCTLIGLYGVGFLSAMAVSERVEVWSKAVGSAPNFLAV